MPTTTVSLRWTGGMQFEGIGRYGQRVLLDTGKASGGSESGHQPTELLLWSLAGCTGMDVVSILRKQRQELTGLTIDVIGENAETHPRPYHTITVTYKAAGRHLDPQKLEHAIELSESKYCIVNRTLHDSPTVRTRYEITDASGSDESDAAGELAGIALTPFSATLRVKSSVNDICSAIEQTAEPHGFRVLAVHDVQQTLAEKGFSREPLKIIEVCNASFAHEALQRDMAAALFMPCRFTVYSDAGETVLSLARPVLIAQMLTNPDLAGMAQNIEQKLLQLMVSVR